jgi:hypothetical protein
VDDAGYREPGPPAKVFESIGGIDTLRRDGDRLVVYSPEPMPDWKRGRYRRTAVHFRGERYAVVEARPVVAGHQYVLEPWPSCPNELASQEIIYDDAYVRARRGDLQDQRRRRRQAWMIAPAWPFLGFLPRSLKSELRRRFGFQPTAGTRLSVLFELVATVFLLIFTFVRAACGLDWATMKVGGGGALRDALLVILLLTDFVLRASILYDDDYPPYGFWEWVVHPDLKDGLRRSYEAYRARRSARDQK